MLDTVSVVIPVRPGEQAQAALLAILDATQAEIIFSSEQGRARSLNAGALKASRTHLWFVHNDTSLTSDAIKTFDAALQQNAQNALYYFRLSLGYGLTTLNAAGANLRSRWFGLPYGDQGLCCSREIWQQCGGYDEAAPYGEDVLFVRRVKKAGVRLQLLPAVMMSSPDTYHRHGWLKTTVYRQWQLCRLLRHPL